MHGNGGNKHGDNKAAENVNRKQEGKAEAEIINNNATKNTRKEKHAQIHSNNIATESVEKK